MDDASAELELEFCNALVPERLCRVGAEVLGLSRLARVPEQDARVRVLLDDIRGLIEQTAPDMDPRDGEDLVNLLRALSTWRAIWREDALTPNLRALLHLDMECWHQRLLALVDRAAPTAPPATSRRR